MPALSDPREEAFAHALATGLALTMACAEAGYAKHRQHGRERAARPDIVARTRELRDERQWGEARDATAMITALMHLAGKAEGMRTPAAMAAARGLVAEAAKLNQRIEERPETPEDAAEVAARYRPLSEEEWIAKHVPPEYAR